MPSKDTSNLKVGDSIESGAGIKTIVQLWKYEIRYREEVPGFRPKNRFCTPDVWDRMKREASEL